MTYGTRVWVETYLVARLGTFIDYDGAPTIGGPNLARVTLDDSEPDRIYQVARRQVRAVTS